MRTRPVDAIVLAAGSSTRLGSPKALVDLGGVTALERILATLAAAGVSSGVVVGGEHFDLLRERVDASPLHFARNPTPEEGRMGSIVIGLAATGANADTLLWPVDRPLANARTVGALREARAANLAPDAVFVPEEGGRRGHPILIAAELRPMLLLAPPDANLREVLTGLGATRVDVPVEDDGIHANLDSRGDVERALRRERGA